MERINRILEKVGIGEGHPDHVIMRELFSTVDSLKSSVEPFISNDPVRHRINITLRGKVFHFLATQDDEYYLRMAAKIINDKSV
jgi:hypothetical protein